jgi:multidrug efflux pump subunit AcrB
VAFMSGIIGKFFYQFGITIAGAVVISLFVAFTLTPMLSSRWLKKEPELGAYKPGLINLPLNIGKWIIKSWNKFFDNFNGRYKTTLEWVLRHRSLTMTMAVIAFAGALVLSNFIGSEFMPTNDQNEMYVNFKAGPDVSLEQTVKLTDLIEQRLRKFPEVTHTFTSIGGVQTPVNQGTVLAKLTPKSERSLSVFKLMKLVREEVSTIAGVTVEVATEAGHGGGGEQQVEYSVRGPDLKVTKSIANQYEDIMRQAPGAVDFQNSEKVARPEIQIKMDRDVASDLGLSIGGVARTIRGLIDGVIVSRLKDKGEEYDIRVQLAPQYRVNADDISRIKIASVKKVGGEDHLFEVGNVATLQWASSPNEINRFNRQREVKVGCNVTEGMVTSDVTNYLDANIQKINIPPGYSISPSGMLQIMGESFQSIVMAMILAVIFIYLLLASQFESFIDPLAIMLSLPLAIVGALIGLYVTNSAISIVSLIGIVLLMGLVTKNAILLIDFAKQQRRKGMSRHDALLTAGPIRLRPILMTTLAMIFGMLPLALGIGPGAEFRAPMARAIIGGLISSTLLTLVVVPVVYTLFDDLARKIIGHETVQAETADESEKEV